MSNQHAKFYHIYSFYFSGNGIKIKIDENVIQLFLKVQQVINIFFFHDRLLASFLILFPSKLIEIQNVFMT